MINICIKAGEAVRCFLIHKLPPFMPFEQKLKLSQLIFILFSSPQQPQYLPSATFPQGSVDLLITGSEVHYQCVHCQPSWLGLEEGHRDLIRRSWVLITSRAKRLWFHQSRLAQVVVLAGATGWLYCGSCADGSRAADSIFWRFIWRAAKNELCDDK